MNIGLATLEGYAVLYFTTSMLRRDPAGCVEQVARLYDRGG